MKRSFCAGLVALVVAGSVSTSAVMAQGGGPMQGGGPAGGGPAGGSAIAIYRQAGINAEQEGQINQLAKDFEAQHRVRLKKVIGLMGEMKQLQLQPTPDDNKVIAKQEEINKEMGDANVERIKLMLAIRKVLTPPQRQKLVEIIARADAARASGQSVNGGGN